jgi:hypothetical protein
VVRVRRRNELPVLDTFEPYFLSQSINMIASYPVSASGKFIEKTSWTVGATALSMCRTNQWYEDGILNQAF